VVEGEKGAGAGVSPVTVPAGTRPACRPARTGRWGRRGPVHPGLGPGPPLARESWRSTLPAPAEGSRARHSPQRRQRHTANPALATRGVPDFSARSSGRRRPMSPPSPCPGC